MLARLLLGVLGVGCGDGIVETAGEGVRVTGGEAGGGDGVADDDQEGAGMQGVDVDGEQLIGSDEGEGDEGDLGFDGHVGTAGHHGLELTGRGSASFRKEDEREALFESRDAAVEAGNERAGAVHVDRNLAGVIEVPTDEGYLPEALLREDAELEREASEEDRGVHVTEVVGGVDGGFVDVELVGSNDFDRREANEQEGSGPLAGDGVLLAARLVP
jgi:hypothetical protein